MADATYDTEAIRPYLRRRGIKCSIPENRRNRKKSSRGKQTRFEEESYKKRGDVERFFAWIKFGFRRIAQMRERLDECFLGFVYLQNFLLFGELHEF